MIRATTPTHHFALPFGSDYIKKLLITYKQGDDIVLEKTENDVSWNDNVISVSLTQEETLLFSAKNSVKIQIRVLTQNDAALASQVYTVTCSDVLNPEVLI